MGLPLLKGFNHYSEFRNLACVPQQIDLPRQESTVELTLVQLPSGMAAVQVLR